MIKFCSFCCQQADKAVVLDDAHRDTSQNGIRGEQSLKSYMNGEAKKLQDGSVRFNKELYYFDAVDKEQVEDDEDQQEEEEEEMDDFFDAISDNLKGELAVLLRAETVADDMLLESCFRDRDADSVIAATTCTTSRLSRRAEEWGFPGSLSPRQLVAYQEFRSELQKRDVVDYREMVYCYKEIEPEPYALCRFLRWSNFNPTKTFKYMDEHVEQWREAKKHNFYPDANVGCPLSVLLTQFPSVYTGYAREGFPVCYFHSGNLSIEGIECVTDLDRLPYFIWYTMLHDIRRIYAEAIARNPSLGRLEQITVMNLNGLSPKLVTPSTYAVSQQVDAVAQAFPEMMYRCIIINAPSFFTIMWNTFKYLLDPNTTKRIEIYSSEEKGFERLKELIDESELPTDYGGLASSTSETILREGRKGPVPRRQVVELMNIRKRRESKIEFELANDEKISIEIFTRSTSTTEFLLFNDEDEVIKQIEVEKSGGVVCPYSVLFGNTTGPGKFSIVGRHLKGQSSLDHFLVVGEVFAIETE